MNDRIRELAEQAHFYQADDNYFTAAQEEFARLIVQECALLCVSRPGPGDDISSREHCSEQILQHFGVEE